VAAAAAAAAVVVVVWPYLGVGKLEASWMENVPNGVEGCPFVG